MKLNQPCEYTHVHYRGYIDRFRYGTTLMALCFSKYESKGVSESFKKICRNEFAYRCDSDRLNTNGINLYFCDQVKSPDLLAFHRKTPVEQIKKALEEKQRFMEDSE